MIILKIKKLTKNKIKKVAFKILKPFLPFIAIIFALFFAICLIIDTIFISTAQADSSSMSEQERRIKNLCIEKANYLNTCHNYVGDSKTNSLLDLDNREIDKQIQWSHLYTLMTFCNMTNNREINEDLLNEVGKEFESTFIYEKYIVKVETTIKDENGKETTITEEQTQFLLIESDTIIGHYKYYYEERTSEENNSKTTKKIFKNEELIGQKYERLSNYLRNTLHIRESDIDNDTLIIIEAANGYYEGKENTDWLQGNSSSSTIISNGKGLVPTRHVYLASTWIYKYNFSFWYALSPYLSYL